MDNDKGTVLVVDDEPFNLEILTEQLEDEGYETVEAENGALAWTLLEKTPDRFDAVLLDRMMPELDGMEVVARIKAHPDLRALPIIMQTAKAAKEDVLAGLKVGAYYYLTKPFEKDQMLAIVKSAVADYRRYRALREETRRTIRTLTLMDYGKFKFRTLTEGRTLVTLLANALPEASRVVMGLSELVINAIEHGNLGISYADKSRLNERGTWEEEVNRRLALPANATKTVHLEFERTQNEVRFFIQDQGDGFEWQDYLEFSSERAFDTHGRGIAMARAVSFDRLEYRGTGNQVMAALSLNSRIL